MEPPHRLSPGPRVMNRVNWMYSLIMEGTKSQSDSLVKVPPAGAPWGAAVTHQSAVGYRSAAD